MTLGQIRYFTAVTVVNTLGTLIYENIRNSVETMTAGRRGPFKFAITGSGHWHAIPEPTCQYKSHTVITQFTYRNFAS